MKVDLQHTHKGRTAGGWLKDARVVKMMAGTFEITTGDYMVELTDSANMALVGDRGGYGIVALLNMSDRAYRRLVALCAERESRYNVTS